jgi:hypothetical protein
MREAFYGTTRFGDFAARAGVSEQIAAARLRSLVAVAQLQHRDCGAPVRVTLECERGHDDLTAAEIEISSPRPRTSPAPQS